MSEEEGLEATVGSLVAAYESGNVTSDVTETLQQLLPFSRYCSVAICGPDDWLAATSNLLSPGSITTSLWPKSESLAGLAALLSRQLRSFQQIADQRLFDVEHFHSMLGPGALIATPLPGGECPREMSAIGDYTSTAVGALIVDLDLQPATPVDLRMRAHLRTLAGMLAPLIEAPGRAAVEELCAACFPSAALGGSLGAGIPPPKLPVKPRRRRGPTCEDAKKWLDDDEADAPGCAQAVAQNPFLDDATAAFEHPQPVNDAQQTRPNRPFMDLSPISSSLLPSRPAAAATSTAEDAAGSEDEVLSEARGPGEGLSVDVSAAVSGSLSSEDTARASKGLLGRASMSPRLSSIEWPTGDSTGECQLLKHRLAPASISFGEATTSTEQGNYDDVVAAQMAARAEKLASAAQQHPLWLSFRDKDLERNFAAWHSLQLQKLDRAAISFASFIFAYLGFVAPHSLAVHAPVAYSVTAALMLFLLCFAWIANPGRYLARRTLLLKAFVLLYTVFNTQVGFPGVLNAMHGGDGPCTLPFVLRYINAQPLLTSCVVTMARLSIQAPIQAIQLAISLGLPRQVCRACYTSRSHAACLLNMHTQQLLVGFLAPLAIVYIAERRFRANFLSSQAKKLS